MQLEQHYKIAENLGDLCRQKLDVRNATYWYDKALATIDDLLGGMIDEKQQKSAMGTKGMLANTHMYCPLNVIEYKYILYIVTVLQ